MPEEFKRTPEQEIEKGKNQQWDEEERKRKQELFEKIQAEEKAKQEKG